MPRNPFDSADPALLDIATRVPGPAGSLPFTPEMLRERPSGDLFGWTQNAGMGWEAGRDGRPGVPDPVDARRHSRRRTARRSRSGITPATGRSGC